MDGAAGQERIVPLSRLLSSASSVTELPAASPPDPMALLEVERQRVLQAAREQGLAEGRELAESEARRCREKIEREVRTSLANAQAETERLNGQLARLLSSAEEASAGNQTRMAELLVELTYCAVLRVIGASAAETPLIQRICAQALTEATQRPVVMHVHPGEAALVARIAETAGVDLCADDRIARGHCLLRTHKGDYDTSLESRLNALTLALLTGLQQAERT